MKNAMPTMKDVAQEAGVALGTVSKVFNGIPVGESYRIKVEEAARKLGYQVNQYARGLKTNKTNTVAVILPGVNHPFFAALAHHICEALARRDYRMLLYVTASNPEIEQNCVNMVRQNKADGIIGLTYNPLVVGEDLPFVGIDRSFRADIPCVAADNYGGEAAGAGMHASGLPPYRLIQPQRDRQAGRRLRGRLPGPADPLRGSAPERRRGRPGGIPGVSACAYGGREAGY